MQMPVPCCVSMQANKEETVWSENGNFQGLYPAPKTAPPFDCPSRTPSGESVNTGLSRWHDKKAQAIFKYIRTDRKS